MKTFISALLIFTLFAAAANNSFAFVSQPRFLAAAHHRNTRYVVNELPIKNRAGTPLFSSISPEPFEDSTVEDRLNERDGNLAFAMFGLLALGALPREVLGSIISLAINSTLMYVNLLLALTGLSLFNDFITRMVESKKD